MQMRQRDVAALDAKYAEELADAKAENDALRDDVAAGRRQFCASKQSVSRCGKPPPPPAWIMQPPRLADTAERDYFTLKRKRYWRNNWKRQKYINEQCSRLPISMGNSLNYCEQYTRASSGV